MATQTTALPYYPVQDYGVPDRERLILEHLPQVRWVASRIHDRLPQSTSLEDLISVGVVGLIQAIDNFDSSLNVKLKTYAEFKIRGAILDSIRGMDGVSTYHRRKIKDIQGAMRTLQNTLQRQPAELEIANHLGISLAEYHEWLLDVRGVTIGSLDEANEGGFTLGQAVPDTRAHSPEQQLEKSELSRLLREAIETIPKMEQIVLDLYFEKELTLRDIGRVMSLHATRIHQLKNQAVLRLRSQLAPVWPNCVAG
jgi:RNA polymerase sigma factor for flagellar operon FliA